MGKKEDWHPFWLEQRKTWAVDFRVNGRRIRKRIPVHGRRQKKLATELARRFYIESWDAALADCDRKEITFAEAAELYVNGGGEERFLKKIIDYLGPKVGVDELDEAAIARAAAALYPSARPDTVRRQLRVPVRAVQHFAAGKRRQKSTDVTRVRWLTPEEAERMLLAAASPSRVGLRDPQLHTLRKIAFMLGTGAGPGETMALTAEGWNPATREWWLPGTKSVFRQRFVLLPHRSIDLIGEVPDTGRAFLAPNGQPYVLGDNRGGQMAEAFRKVRKAAGLGPDVVPYTLRHSWATWFYAQTKDWGALLDYGGWNRSDTANRYRKIAPSDLGHRLLAHGWDFRPDCGKPVRYGALVSLRRYSDADQT